MIIKVAIKKEDKKIVWRDPYSAAIRNRLRIDLNLSDVKDKDAGLTNLGVKSYVSGRIGDIGNKTVKTYVDETRETLRKEIAALAEKEANDIRNLQAQIQHLSDQLAQTMTDINTIVADMKDYVGSSIESASNNTKSAIDALEVMPVGTILPYVGNINNIPANWHICNGTAGTVDLRNKFVMGVGTYGVKTNIAAGLPNITGKFKGGKWPDNIQEGAFRIIGNGNCGNKSSGDAYKYDFDASRCSAIYGRSNTVQPPAIAVYYIQKISA